MTMKLKTIEIEGKTYAEVNGDKPVYVEDDGKEIAFDAPASMSSMKALRAEAKGHREAKEALEARVKAFDGIEDAESARKALATVANLDAKKLVDAGEVEKVKNEVAKVWQAKHDEQAAKTQALEQQLHRQMIAAAFGQSQFIKAKVAETIPGDMLRAVFEGRFVPKDGQLVPHDKNGQPIYSRSNPGSLASFDEAIETMVMERPDSSLFLRPSGAAGSGGDGTPSGTKRELTLTEQHLAARQRSA